MMEILVVELNDSVEPVILISAYRSPLFPLKQFLHQLNQVLCKADNSFHLIFMSDLNVDLLARSSERDSFMKYLSNNGFMQVIAGVSTNYGSQLDCLFIKNFACSCSYYESYFSDHKPLLIYYETGVNVSIIDNQTIEPHHSVCTHILINQPSYPHATMDFEQISTNSMSEVVQDVIISNVYIPTPIVPPIAISNNANSFTYAMRQSLAQSINLQGIPLRPTNFTVCRVTATNYYDFMHTNIKDRFNLRIVPVTGDGNCFFRTLSQIIFGEESEHHNVRSSLIETFEQSPYAAALCGIQAKGNNEIHPRSLYLYEV